MLPLARLGHAPDLRTPGLNPHYTAGGAGVRKTSDRNTEGKGQGRSVIYGNVLPPGSAGAEDAGDRQCPRSRPLLATNTEECMPDKSRHVLDQLPQHAAAMRERMIVDREFRSLCEDYGETIEALRRWEASDDRHRQERVEEFRTLLAELELEIARELGVA